MPLGLASSLPIDPEKLHPTSPQICSDKGIGGGGGACREFAIGSCQFAGSHQFVPSSSPLIGVTLAVKAHLEGLTASRRIWTYIYITPPYDTLHCPNNMTSVWKSDNISVHLEMGF